jgi:Na+/proline symporter
MSFSGTNAVILTDVIQYILVALFFVIIYFAGLKNSLVNTDIFKLSLTKINFFFIFLTLLAYLPGWLAETDIWIRLQVTKNGYEARKAMGIAILNSVLFVFLMPLLVASVVKPHITSGVNAVSYLLSLISNPIIAAVTAIGLIAASMSTIDTCTNVAAMTVSYDLTKKKTNNKNIASIWITGFAACLFAFYSNSLKDAFYLSSGLLSTSLFLPVLSCYFEKPSKKGVLFVLKFAPVITLIFFILEKEKILFLKEGEGISYILFSLLFVVSGYILIFLNAKNK